MNSSNFIKLFCVLIFIGLNGSSDINDIVNPQLPSDEIIQVYVEGGKFSENYVYSKSNNFGTLRECLIF